MNKVFCLLGPSGTGKNTIKKMLNIPYTMSYMTRKKREEEAEGVDGKFITLENFEKKLKNNDIISYSKYNDHYYGITKDEIISLKYSNVVYVCDYLGLNYLKNYFKESKNLNENQIVSIYIDSPFEVLATRMRVQERDRNEIEMTIDKYWEEDFIKGSSCDYTVFNSQGKINQTVEKIKSIIKIESIQKQKV